MRCEPRALVLVGALAVAACASPEAPVLVATTIAGRPVELVPPAEPAALEAGPFRWELLEAPLASAAPAPASTAARATFTPDVRGGYLIARWREGAVGDDLTHFFEVTASPLAPTAQITGAFAISLGEPVRLEGAGSVSPEGRRLRYAWRLATRPAGSTLQATTTDVDALALTPDVAGIYWFELAVFDGELWSEPPAAHRLTVIDAP